MTTQQTPRPPACFPTPNTGKVLTKQIRDRDRTTLTLSYTKADANELRKLVQRIRLKGDKKPSMSVLSRRALDFYLSKLPGIWEAEMAELHRMTTPVPSPRLKGEPWPHGQCG